MNSITRMRNRCAASFRRLLRVDSSCGAASGWRGYVGGPARLRAAQVESGPGADRAEKRLRCKACGIARPAGEGTPAGRREAGAVRVRLVFDVDSVRECPHETVAAGWRLGWWSFGVEREVHRLPRAGSPQVRQGKVPPPPGHPPPLLARDPA